MVLLVGAGLLLHSFVRVLLVPPGFEPNGALVIRTTFNVDRYPTGDRRRAAARAMLERLAALPGVSDVALTTHLPLADARTIGFTIDGRDPNEYHWAANALVSERYFHVMRIPMLSGRGFGAEETPAAPATVVINETMAKRYWPGANPLGRAVFWAGQRLTIVGVSGDVRVTAIDAP